ncbi:hypothetical protein Vadar_029777 [Vaccinium darrowii]|uniref:Uncharacterized protein n=1 Tax=Vaccinium darrowii TaxID=229202 RepID=A0ACB7Y2I8_9ERIC|nr:hypothetical protein Vadar_029777 [Vaccinium darrowii]
MTLTLVHFYPLAGRLVTHKQENPHSYSVYVDCNNSPGAKFIYATANLSISDILSPVDVPLVVQSFFDHQGAVNHDGHTMSLLSIQVTELIDGIFIGCSINHVVADGTSNWHFFDMLSSTFRAKEKSYEISRPQILTRWFPDGCGPIINLPFSHHNQFIRRVESPPHRARIFHFSSQTVAQLKKKANSECKTLKISSFQAVSALLWRCVTRARRVPPHQETTCSMFANNRNRMEPPLPNEYFGNSVQTVSGKASAGELLEHGFGWAAWQLHEAVVGHSAMAVQEWIEKWIEHPFMYIAGNYFGTMIVKFEHEVVAAVWNEGGGSMDVEVCLFPEAMSRLESDGEFMDAVNGMNQALLERNMSPWGMSYVRQRQCELAFKQFL